MSRSHAARPARLALATLVSAAGTLLSVVPSAAQAPAGYETERTTTLFFHLAQQWRRDGEHAEAARALERVVASAPEAVEPRLQWAEELLALNRPGRAMEALEPLAARDEEVPAFASRYHHLRAAAHLRLGNTEAAVEEYERASDYAPADLGLRAQLIGLYRLTDSPEDALRHMRAVTERVPNDPDLRAQSARMLLGLERWEEAEAEYRAAIRLGDGSADVWDGLGVALAAQGEFPEAIETFRAGLRAAPASARLYEHLGDVLLATGRSEEALAAFERAAVLDDSGSNETLAEKIDRARAAIGP